MVNTKSFFFNYASTRRIGLRGNDGPGSEVAIEIMGLLKSTVPPPSSFQRKLESRKVVPGCLDKLRLSQIRAAQRVRRIGLRGDDRPGSKVEIEIMGLLKSQFRPRRHSGLPAAGRRRPESRKALARWLDALRPFPVHTAQRIRVVIPACLQAAMDGLNHWIPACAGMTNRAKGR